MSKVSKTPEIPEDEMLLAVMIQNAKAFALQPIRGAMYQTSYGGITTVFDKKTVIGCCAMGAYYIEPTGDILPGIIMGNDYKNDNVTVLSPVYCKGFTVGQAFQHAMSEDG